jgi:ABC-type multidrug transport system fused ATPase/permease subunit
MAGYKQVDPSIPDRFMSITESYATNHQKLDRWRAIFDGVSVLMGQFFAWTAFLGVIGLGGWLIYQGHDAGWILSIGGALVALAQSMRGGSSEK